MHQNLCLVQSLFRSNQQNEEEEEEDEEKYI